MVEVQKSLVLCAAAGDCSSEAAALPSLIASEASLINTDGNKTKSEIAAEAHTAAITAWENCYKQNGRFSDSTGGKCFS